MKPIFIATTVAFCGAINVASALEFRYNAAASRKRDRKLRDHKARSSRIGDIQHGDAEYLTACIKPYPGYSGKRKAWGNIKITFTGEGSFMSKVQSLSNSYDEDDFDPDNQFLFEFDLKGLDDHCKDCGIHIHEGKTCKEEDEVGDHFWDDEGGKVPDPWTKELGATYRSNNNGKANGEFSLNNGYDRKKNKGRVVVVDAQDPDVRIGCGVLKLDDTGVCNDRYTERTKKSKEYSKSKMYSKSKDYSKSERESKGGKSSKSSKSGKGISSKGGSSSESPSKYGSTRNSQVKSSPKTNPSRSHKSKKSGKSSKGGKGEKGEGSSFLSGESRKLKIRREI